MKRMAFDVLGQFLDHQQRLAYLDFMQNHRPTTTVIMDNVQLALDASTATEGETIVIHRKYFEREADVYDRYTPERYVKEITHDGTIPKHIWLQVLNEPGTAPKDCPKLCNWLVRVGLLLEEAGYHAVLGNIGPATVQPETIASGVFDDYLRKLADWSERGIHYGGWHEYTGIVLPFGVGYWAIDDLRSTAKMQPEWWPEIIAQIDVPAEPNHYWHLMRTEWFQQRAIDIGAKRHKVVLTEFGWDRMPDLTKPMPNIYEQLQAAYGATGHFEIRGPRTLENVWRAYWPYWSYSEAVYYQLEWADRNYPADYIGFNLFCWAFDGHLPHKEQNWENLGYNFGDLVELHHLLMIEPPPDDDPDDDPPDDENTLPSLIKWGVGLFVFAVLVAILYSLIMPRLTAQGATMEGIITFPEMVDIFMAALTAALAGGLAAPVTTPLVNLVKFLLQKAGLEENEWFKGDNVSLFVAGGVTLATIASRYFGYELQLATFADWLTTAIPVVIGLLTMVVGQKAVHSFTAKRNIPVFGYQRSK
jgi:hypothetical protein